ncbi:MAG TPA: hypothetical protein PLF35_04520 [Prolixibacteraceae bacterium]|nr:hypothetical protein [Prolixibacteraceae bacterium]
MTKKEIDQFLTSAYSKAEYELMFEKARTDRQVFDTVWEMATERPDHQSWRLLWILDHATEKSNQFIFPILGQLYARLLKTNNESFIRQGMKLVLRCPIDEDFAGELLERCIVWMTDPKKKISSQCMGLEFFYRVCQIYPEMKSELLAYIENISEWAVSAGYKHRLKEIRKNLDK